MFRRAIFAPRLSRHQVFDGLKPLANDVQAIVEAARIKRVFVVAHGLSAGYAVEWAAAHRELVAGFLLLDSVEDNYMQAPRMRALFGSPADRQAYIRTLVPESTNVEKIAAAMRDRARYLDLVWLQTTASLLGYSLYETSERLKDIPIFTSGQRFLVGVEPVESPGPFAMIENPAKLAAPVESLINNLSR